MTIIENGFLDNKHKDLIKKHIKANQELFDLLYGYNRLLYKLLYSFDGMKKNNEIDYIVPAFAKITKLYQSCIILIEYGIPDISESLLRSIYDLKFQMLYVWKSDINYQRLIKNMFNKEINKLNYIDKTKSYTNISKTDVENFRKLWKSTNEQLKNISCAPDTKQMCEELGIENEYILYTMLCNDSHQSCDVIYSLNKEKGIDILPNYNAIYKVAFRLIEIINPIISNIVEKYAKQFTDEYEELINQYTELFQKKIEK